MLRTHLDFQAQLKTTRATAIQAIESRTSASLDDNHPVNMIVDDLTLHEFFKQRNRTLAAYIESEYGAFQEKKAVAITGYTIEQAQQDILSSTRQTKANGFFHLAYYGRYDLCTSVEVEHETETTQDPKTMPDDMVAKTAMLEGAAVAGHVEVVFAILEKEQKSASHSAMIKGALSGAARGGHGMLLHKLLHKLLERHEEHEQIIIEGFQSGGFLASENHRQLVSILYCMREKGPSLLRKMQTSSLVTSDLVLPTQLDHIGLLSAKMMMGASSERERVNLIISTLQDIPPELMEVVLHYYFNFSEQSDSEDFKAMPEEEKDRVTTVVIRQLLKEKAATSKKSVINAGIACLHESTKLDLALFLIFPVWIYKNWNVTKIFFQLLQEKTDENRYAIAQQHITQFPNGLFAKKLQQIMPQISIEPTPQAFSRPTQ